MILKEYFKIELRKTKEHIRGNYKEPTNGKFDDCTSEILKNLAAEDSSGSESDVVEGNG